MGKVGWVGKDLGFEEGCVDGKGERGCWGEWSAKSEGLVSVKGKQAMQRLPWPIEGVKTEGSSEWGG